MKASAKNASIITSKKAKSNSIPVITWKPGKRENNGWFTSRNTSLSKKYLFWMKRTHSLRGGYSAF